MIKAIVFDFDGVIVESVDIKTNAFARLFEHHGQDIVKQVVDYHLKHAGVSRFEKFKYYYKTVLKTDLTDHKFKELCERFSDLVMEQVIRAPYVKGAKEFLDSYSAAYKCFIATGTPQAEIENIVKKRSMGRYFAGIYGAPTMKPDAVRDVIECHRLPPDEIVYAGDAMSDYEAAVKNSIHFIARINDNEHIFKGVDCIKVKDLRGFKEILDRIKSR